MKPEEIMIGDWVYDKHYNGDIEPIQIHNIYGNDVNCKTERNRFDVEEIVSGTYIKNLMPIPLTPEILKKNGWFPLDEYRYEGDIALAKGRDYFRLKNTTICINSVHGLQHTLRLCGIDKELTV